MDRTAASPALQRSTTNTPASDTREPARADSVGWKRMLPPLLLAQAIAIMLVVSRYPVPDATAWAELLSVSGFCLSVGIVSGVGMAMLSSPLKRLSPLAAGVLATVIVLTAYVLVFHAALSWMAFLGMTDLPWVSNDWVVFTRGLVIAMCAGILMAAYLAALERMRAERASKTSERLQALQSRIRPHFLFNSMNSVASLIPSDPEMAERALQDLADVFRMLLADARTLVPISVEVELARQYLNIEKLRLGDRLQVKWTLSEVPRSAQIPALTLQPLLENAVYHGIEPRFAGGTIHVQLWTERKTLNIMISNPLPDSGGQARKQGNQLAINNVHERLTTHFGRRASMQNVERSGQYHVSIRLPVVRG